MHTEIVHARHQYLRCADLYALLRDTGSCSALSVRDVEAVTAALASPLSFDLVMFGRMSLLNLSLIFPMSVCCY